MDKLESALIVSDEPSRSTSIHLMATAVNSAVISDLGDFPVWTVINC